MLYIVYICKFSIAWSYMSHSLWQLLQNVFIWSIFYKLPIYLQFTRWVQPNPGFAAMESRSCQSKVECQYFRLSVSEGMQVNRRDYYNNNIVIIIIIMTYCSVYVHYEQGQPHIFLHFWHISCHFQLFWTSLICTIRQGYVWAALRSRASGLEDVTRSSKFNRFQILRLNKQHIQISPVIWTKVRMNNQKRFTYL